MKPESGDRKAERGASLGRFILGFCTVLHALAWAGMMFLAIRCELMDAPLVGLGLALFAALNCWRAWVCLVQWKELGGCRCGRGGMQWNGLIVGRGGDLLVRMESLSSDGVLTQWVEETVKVRCPECGAVRLARRHAVISRRLRPTVKGDPQISPRDAEAEEAPGSGWNEAEYPASTPEEEGEGWRAEDDFSPE